MNRYFSLSESSISTKLHQIQQYNTINKVSQSLVERGRLKTNWFYFQPESVL